MLVSHNLEPFFKSLLVTEPLFEFPESCNNLEGREMGRRIKREGTFVYLWLISVDIWQKATTFRKAIVLQLKKYFLKCACTQILFLNKISNSVDLWSGPRRTKKPLDESERAE